MSQSKYSDQITGFILKKVFMRKRKALQVALVSWPFKDTLESNKNAQ